MGTNLLRVQLWLLVALAIVAVGWKAPLRDRFFPPPPPTPEPAPAAPPVPAQWNPMGTALDRAPYVKKHGGVIYTNNIDMQKMGTATETGLRPNTHTTGTGGR